MMCYKDRTYCQVYLLCKEWQKGDCLDGLTPDVIDAAEKAGLPISQMAGFPDCFVPWFEEEKEDKDGAG
jgi:hypothetical protein